MDHSGSFRTLVSLSHIEHWVNATYSYAFRLELRNVGLRLSECRQLFRKRYVMSVELKADEASSKALSGNGGRSHADERVQDNPWLKALLSKSPFIQAISFTSWSSDRSCTLAGCVGERVNAMGGLRVSKCLPTVFVAKITLSTADRT